MLKQIFSALCVLVVCFLLLSGDALAANKTSKGERIFSQVCSSCHAGGRNNIVAEKNLSKEALEEYDMYSVEKIAYQVTNGSANRKMAAFGKPLGSKKIKAVAQYVFDQATNGCQEDCTKKGWSK